MVVNHQSEKQVLTQKVEFHIIHAVESINYTSRVYQDDEQS